jgi:outer membrane protein OmpA-like peptidoglycan-associated protein
MKRKHEIAILAGIIAASCATVDVPTPALIQAREAVRAAQTDAAVQSGAPLELRRATEALDRADRALVNGEPPREIDHYAYVARRRAETAMALAAAKTDEGAIKSAEVDRERARADMRTLEAQAARADAEAQRAQAAAATQQAAIAQQQAQAMRAQAAQANQMAAQSQAEAQAAQSQAEQSRAQAQAAEARAAELQRRLADLEATKVDRGRVVTLGDVLFEFNRAEVRPTAQARLAKLADFLKQYPERKILIEGHTDNVGSSAYNDQLSTRRAESIRFQLAALGVASDRMTTIGYGKDFPIAGNDTDTNRALNRRVEVYISETDQPVRPRR